MTERKARQRFFVSREINISIALIVLWSFLAVGFLMYVMKQVGGLMSDLGIAAFLAVMGGYALVVIMLTVFFSRRLIGPFKRLNSEIGLILNGQYSRRLRVRLKDDVSVRAFVSQINNILDRLEQNRDCSYESLGHIQSELSMIIHRIRNENLSAEEIVGLLSGINRKAVMFLEDQKVRDYERPPPEQQEARQEARMDA